MGKETDDGQMRAEPSIWGRPSSCRPTAEPQGGLIYRAVNGANRGGQPAAPAGVKLHGAAGGDVTDPEQSNQEVPLVRLRMNASWEGRKFLTQPPSDVAMRTPSGRDARFAGFPGLLIS